jgi:peptide/nickel transport system substrate-binding protein
MMGVVLLLVASCGTAAPEGSVTTGPGATAPAATEATPVPTTAPPAGEGRVLTIGTNNNPVSWDSAGQDTTMDWNIITNFNSSLYRMDGDEAVPDMAVALPEVSEDGLTYTVTLRDDIMFGDGLPLTAQLYAEQFQRTLDFGTLGAEIRVLPFVESVEAIDDYTLAFHLTDLNAVMTSWMTTASYSVSHPDIFPADQVLNLPEPPVYGTGPFVLIDYDLTEGRIVLEPNPYYYGDPPPWDQVIYRLFEDPQTMALSLQNGEIDVAWKTLIEDQLAPLRDDPNITAASFSEGLLYFIVNHKLPPSDDPNVNQAVAAVIDREAVLDRAFGGLGHLTAYSPIPYNVMGSTPIFQTKFNPPNVELAESLLAESGYSRDNPVHITMGVSTSQWGPVDREAVELFATQLNETGLFDVELLDIEWATYLEGLLAGETYNYAWLDKSPVSDPAQVTGLFVSGTGVGTWVTDEDDNPIYDGAQEMLDLLALGQGQLDPEARLETYHQVEELWSDMVVTIPLFLKLNELAYRSDRIQGDPSVARPEALGIGLNDHFYVDWVIPVDGG